MRPEVLLALLLLAFRTGTIWGEVVRLFDENFDHILNAFPSHSALILFTDDRRVEAEYDVLSSDPTLRGVLVARVDNGASAVRTRRQRIRFGIRDNPTLLYLRDERMYRYRGNLPGKAGDLRSFVLKGYENNGEGELIPQRLGWLGGWIAYAKAAYSEVGGETWYSGHAVVLLTGIVLGLVGMAIFVAVVVSSRRFGAPTAEDKNR